MIRSSVQVGLNPALTSTFDDANRPTADSAGGTYASDADGPSYRPTRIPLHAGRSGPAQHGPAAIGQEM